MNATFRKVCYTWYVEAQGKVGDVVTVTKKSGKSALVRLTGKMTLDAFKSGFEVFAFTNEEVKPVKKVSIVASCEDYCDGYKVFNAVEDYANMIEADRANQECAR